MGASDVRLEAGSRVSENAAATSVPQAETERESVLSTRPLGVAKRRSGKALKKVRRSALSTPSNLTHVRLLRAAATVFVERGYHGATLDEIARRLNILKGSVYYYVRGKSDLLNQVITESGDELFRRVEDVAKSDESAESKLRSALGIHLDLLTARAPAFFVLLQDRLPIAPALRRTLREQQANYRKAWLAIIKQGVQDGVFRSDLDADITFLAIIDMATWAHRWYKKNGRLTTQQIGDLYADLVLDGMRSRP